MSSVIEFVTDLKGTFFTVVIIVLLYLAVKYILDRQAKGKPDWGIIRSIILFGILLIGVIALILSLPMDDNLRSQISSLIGIVISAVLALSSATLMGNGLAGIMLRTINNFKLGDFIKVEEYFGRITERGLLHTEIQTEDRDLTTIPNMYLVTHPIKVMRSSGTFISGVVSLGYDVHRAKVEAALLSAAKSSKLKDPFVRITELGDFSIIYKVYGLLENINSVLSARSILNAHILDSLHDAKIEIVSPGFVNQRQYKDPAGVVFIPEKPASNVPDTQISDDNSDKVIFDKAEEAESLEKKKAKLEELNQKLDDLTKAQKNAVSEEQKSKYQSDIEKWKAIKSKLEESVSNQHQKIVQDT